jgi:tRNA pseudouridine55 synthase
MLIELGTGFLLINKPAGITSYGCIGYLKRIIRQKKVKIGHAGTLDPFATGLLIVAIGREATKLMSRIMTLEKTYVAKAKLGELTDTLDYTGTVIKTVEAPPISAEMLCNALLSFGSSYEQTPPLYSALKYQGDALYKLVRQKRLSEQELEEIAEQKKKIVQLYQLELLSYEFPFFTIKARVSHGTYIRSLVNDIAERVGSCATTYELERSAIGKFMLDASVDLYTLNTVEDINQHLIAVEDIDF